MISNLHIETALFNNNTILKRCFHTPPFKVLDVTEGSCKTTLHLMLMNASPGVLDGDQYNLQIDLAAGSSMQLHTQSYQRLFYMKKEASQSVVINMQENSLLCYVPHPTVPHRNAVFTTKAKIFLSPNCTLLWGEILTCGRKGSGEQFTFSKYHSITEIFVKARLVVKENLLLQPPVFDCTALGQLEGYTHQASFIYLNEEMQVQELMDHLHHLLSVEQNISFGVSALPAPGFIVRILGYKGEQLYGLLKKLAAELLTHDRIKSIPIIQEEHHAN